MLQSVTFKNFLSFKNETTIELLPGRMTYLSKSNIHNGTLKGCGFYGPNGSGKSNAIKAISLLLGLLFDDGFKINEPMYSIGSSDSPMAFEYSFLIQNRAITYSFEHDLAKGFLRETLYLDDELILNRAEEKAEIDLGTKRSIKGIDPYVSVLKELSADEKLSDYPALAKWFSYLRTSKVYSLNDALNETNLIMEGGRASSNVEAFLEARGVKSINEFLLAHAFPFRMEYISSIDRNFNKALPLRARIYYVYKDGRDIPYYLESQGNKTLLSFLVPYLSVINDGGMFLVDDLSGLFHNKVEELLVRYFYARSKAAQLFFSSHSTNILKTSIIRPDQVYAVELDNEGSHISSFYDYGMREAQNMEKMYVGGLFGGLPDYLK